jgi:hypothetical protein
LIRFENFNTGAHAEFVVAEELNEAQSGAVSQGFEKYFEVGAHLLLVTISRLGVFARDISGKGAKKHAKAAK